MGSKRSLPHICLVQVTKVVRASSQKFFVRCTGTGVHVSYVNCTFTWQHQYHSLAKFRDTNGPKMVYNPVRSEVFATQRCSQIPTIVLSHLFYQNRAHPTPIDSFDADAVFTPKHFFQHTPIHNTKHTSQTMLPRRGKCLRRLLQN